MAVGILVITRVGVLSVNLVQQLFQCDTQYCIADKLAYKDTDRKGGNKYRCIFSAIMATSLPSRIVFLLSVKHVESLST